MSLGLSSTAGLVELLGFNQANPGASVTPALQDYVSWSKTVAAGAQTPSANTDAFLARRPLDQQNDPIIGTPGGGTWQSVQPDTNKPCDLVSADASSATLVANTVSDGTAVTPIHSWILALVAGLALLYVGYEYRADLANHLWQLRSHFGARRRRRR